MARLTPKFDIGLLSVGLLGIQGASRLVPGGVPVGVEFAFSALSIFYFASPLQIHALEQLKKFRPDFRTLLWFVACIAFWYSTVIWTWWSRRTPTFPLFLLNAELVPTYFFNEAPLAVLIGLLLEHRKK